MPENNSVLPERGKGWSISEEGGRMLLSLRGTETRRIHSGRGKAKSEQNQPDVLYERKCRFRGTPGNGSGLRRTVREIRCAKTELKKKATYRASTQRGSRRRVDKGTLRQQKVTTRNFSLGFKKKGLEKRTDKCHQDGSAWGKIGANYCLNKGRRSSP